MREQRRHLGMTIIELTFGLASLSVMGLAIGSLMVAAGNAWDTKEHFVEQTQSMRAVTTRVSEWVRQSRRVVSIASDTRYADLVLWADDDSDAGNVNLGELKVITYDQMLGTLTLHQAAPTAGTVMNPLVVGSDSFGPSFRNRNDVNAYPLAEDVVGFSATATNGMFASSLSYRYIHLTMAFRSPNGHQDQTAMVAAAVRAPDQTIDFLGETDSPDADGGPETEAVGGGLSLSLGVGVPTLDVSAAANADPEEVGASVFVGTSILGVNTGLGSGPPVVQGDQANSGNTPVGRNSNSGSNSNNSSNSRNNRVGGRDSDADRDRGRGNDNRIADRNNRVGGRDSDADRDRGRGNDNRIADRNNRVSGRDSSADRDRGRGNDGHDRGNRSSDRDSRGGRR